MSVTLARLVSRGVLARVALLRLSGAQGSSLARLLFLVVRLLFGRIMHMTEPRFKRSVVGALASVLAFSGAPNNLDLFLAAALIVTLFNAALVAIRLLTGFTGRAFLGRLENKIEVGNFNAVLGKSLDKWAMLAQPLQNFGLDGSLLAVLLAKQCVVLGIFVTVL